MKAGKAFGDAVDGMDTVKSTKDADHGRDVEVGRLRCDDGPVKFGCLAIRECKAIRGCEASRTVGLCTRLQMKQQQSPSSPEAFSM